MLDGSAEPEYLQAYFLVAGKRMFTSQYWLDFWKRLPCSEVYRKAVETFDISFTSYFSEKGFRFSSYLDENAGSKYIKKRVNPYIEYSYDIIKDGKFPVVKFRALAPFNCKNASLVLQYIRENTEYDTDYIFRHLQRVEQEGRMRPWGVSELKAFVEGHRKIYIFGHGQYGKGLGDYFRIMNWKMSGFVVSKPKEEEEIGLQDLVCDRDDGLIVALGIKNMLEMESVLKEKFEKEQLLLPHVHERNDQ